MPFSWPAVSPAHCSARLRTCAPRTSWRSTTDAARSDPTVREAEARRMAALEAKPQARGLLLPQINVNGQYATRDNSSQSTFPQAVDDDDNEATPPIVVQVPNDSESDSDFWNYQAQITQTLFRWDQWQALKRADAQVAVAEATYRAAQQNLLVRVSRAYFDVLAAEDTLLAAEAALQAFSRQLEQAEKRFEVGLIAVTDVQESRAAHDSATAGVIAAKRALASSQEALRELTGESYAALVKPAETMPLDQPQPLDEQLWVAKSLAEQPRRHRRAPERRRGHGRRRVAQGGSHAVDRSLCDSATSRAPTRRQTNNGITGPADSDDDHGHASACRSRSRFSAAASRTHACASRCTCNVRRVSGSKARCARPSARRATRTSA